MKTLFALLLSLFAATSANARCASRGITVYPQGHYLPPNGQLVLEFFAQSAAMIPQLGKKHPVYLQEFSGKKVPLKVVRVFTGGFRLSQVVLQPATPLLPGHSYELKIGALPVGEVLHGAYEEGKGTYDKPFWTVKSAAKPDATPPVWTKAPALKETSFTAYGCGPARLAHFTATATDDVPGAEVMLLASVRALGSGKTTHFLLPQHWTGAVSVGHGMCSGGFYFEEEGDYEVTFTPVDFAGNAGASSPALRFSQPAPSADSRVFGGER